MEQNTEQMEQMEQIDQWNKMHSYIYSQWLTGCQEHTMGEKMIS